MSFPPSLFPSLLKRYHWSGGADLYTNNSLAAVNFFLGLVGIVQVSRILMWRSSQKELEAQAKGEMADAKEAVKQVVKA